MILKLLIIVFIVTILLATINGEDTAINVFNKTYYPIRSVAAVESGFALTANITDGNLKRDIELLGEVCTGMDAPVCFFATTDWVEANGQTAERIYGSGHVIGMYIEETFNGLGRNEIMRRLALLNDRFFTALGKYPKYVRFATDASNEVCEVLNAYCQYNIASNIVLTGEKSRAVEAGDIVEIESVTGEAPYIAAENLAATVKRGLSVVSLKEILYDIESEVDANGRQTE